MDSQNEDLHFCYNWSQAFHVYWIHSGGDAIQGSFKQCHFEKYRKFPVSGERLIPYDLKAICDARDIPKKTSVKCSAKATTVVEAFPWKPRNNEKRSHKSQNLMLWMRIWRNELSMLFGVIVFTMKKIHLTIYKYSRSFWNWFLLPFRLRYPLHPLFNLFHELNLLLWMEMSFF